LTVAFLAIGIYVGYNSIYNCASKLRSLLLTGPIDPQDSINPADVPLSAEPIQEKSGSTPEVEPAFPDPGSNPEPVGPLSAEISYKTTPANPPDLANFLATQRGEEPPAQESALAEPTYQISPAQPDWSSFALPPLADPPLEEEKPSGWKTAWAVLREVGETIILTLIIFFLIQTVIRNFRVVGTSMVNNLHDGQYLIIDKFSYNPWLPEYFGVSGPQRGDVIVFEPPNRPGEDYVKRIIGLPGETVEVKNGQVFINGQPLDEPFQPNRGTYTSGPITVPADQVFVLGDNRNNSNDSHNWGPLPIEKIVGRAWISYWPPDEWGVIPRDKPTEQATLKYFINELVPQANAGSE
jgi:signal peptidase I